MTGTLRGHESDVQGSEEDREVWWGGAGCGARAGQGRSRHGWGPDRSGRAVQADHQAGARVGSGGGDDRALGTQKHATPVEGGGNIRNGTRSKTVLTDVAGDVSFEVPRDRAGTFAQPWWRSGSRARPATASASPPRSPRPGSASSRSTGPVRPNGADRAKTDPLDAYRAARSVLSGEASTDPKRASIEPLRALNVARRSAVKSRQAVWRQIQALLVNAPADLRGRYRALPDTGLTVTLANSRPAQLTDPDRGDVIYPLRILARRPRDLTEEIAGLEARRLARAIAANPALMSIKGVDAVVGAQLLIPAGDNPDRLRSEASFAALCGTAPIPVSSGRTDRHRLSRGGDRQANAALHHIVKVRLSYDPATQAYRDAHLAKRWTMKVVLRALKHASPAGSSTPWPVMSPYPTTPTSARAPSEEPHPYRSGRTPRRAAGEDRRTRTRPSTQRRTRHPLPSLARRSLKPPPEHFTRTSYKSCRLWSTEGGESTDLQICHVSEGLEWL